LVICWGELLWDRFPDRDRLGGCAGNVAYHLTRLGASVLLVSRVGRDALGDAALSELAGLGVDTRGVGRDAEHPTGSVRVWVEDGEPRYSIATSAAWDRIELTPTVAEAVSRADVFYFGTLAQRTPLGVQTLHDALAHAPPSLRAVCDLNLRRPFVTRDVVVNAAHRSHALKLNEAELSTLEELVGAKDGVGWLLGECGVELVALTLGERGALLANTQERVHVPAPEVSVTAGDAVGAGDAFTAVLARLLGTNLSVAELAERANHYAAFIASQPGAMPAVPDALVSRTLAGLA
jgi:fructokinase